MGLAIPTVLSGIGYCGANFVAKRIRHTPWATYRVRVGIMTAFVVLWWFYYIEFLLRANAGSEQLADFWYGIAFHEGISWGMHSIWAWFAVALIDWPVRADRTIAPRQDAMRML